MSTTITNLDKLTKAQLIAQVVKERAANTKTMAPKPGSIRIMQVDTKRVADGNAAKVAAGKEPNTPTLFVHGSILATVKEVEALVKAAKNATSTVIPLEFKANGWRNTVTENTSICARMQGAETEAVRALRKERAGTNGNTNTATTNAL